MPLKVDGLKQLTKDLESAGVEVADLKAAFGTIAKEARALAAGYAPKKTGALQRSIRGISAKNYASVSAGGKGVAYAGPINYGWKKHGIRSSAFMQKADQSIRPRVLTTLVAAVDKLFREKDLS